MPVVNLRAFARSGRTIVLPPDIIRVDRPSRWGNPYKIGAPLISDFDYDPPRPARPMLRGDVMSLYRRWLDSELIVDPDMLEPLRGKRLACWCSPLPCHADILVEYLERRPRLVVEGIPGRVTFGLDRLPAPIAEEAPAWPPLAEVRYRATATRRRRLEGSR